MGIVTGLKSLRARRNLVSPSWVSRPIINYKSRKKNRPKGHKICPCGYGERRRNNHWELLNSTRENVAEQYVKKFRRPFFGMMDLNTKFAGMLS